MDKKGFGRKFGVGQVAPPELKEVPAPLEMRASPITTGVAAMFAKPKGANKKPAPKAAAKAPKVPKAAAAEPKAEAAEPKAEEAAAELEAAAPEPQAELAEMLEKAEGLTGELKEMADLIIEEEAKDPYSTQVPTAYVPQTRRGFSEFVKGTYTSFELPEGPITIPEGDRFYPYQKFVRDYMRGDSPYRGILVYHGLGSGKTCTAIAASEALYASAKKKIIVMTPFSLKKNFLSEVSFCGFRHFQLNNFWTALDPKDATTTLFANQILGLSGKYLKSARNVWVPDFRKTQAESNYSSLPDHDRDEIRQQILSIIDWHPEKNPSGRIKFISYNGISAKKLMAMACDPNPKKFFDDAIIVVDEIHNLVRLIQGNIQPYMSKVGPGGKKSRRTVPVEEVTHERWAPSLCKEGTKLYTRGYLFYRLLLDARNSKIVGLSGTPLVNFPEELGILSNVLHGYITTLEGVIQQSGNEAVKKAEEAGFKNPYTDYVKAKKDPAGGGIRMVFSLLAPGLRKIENDVGVERIPEEEPQPTFEEIVESIRGSFQEAGVPFTGALKPKSEELLPPFADPFKNHFLTENLTLKNKAVLITRLTGLVSFYKGSQLDKMPRVKSDEIVRVPFSLYSQKAYSFKRSSEVKSELEGKGKQTVDAVFAQVYELGDTAAANNYKMGSRQACNFAFPEDVTRPSPSAKESLEEAEDGEAVAGIVSLGTTEESGAQEYAIELEEDEEDAVQATKEDEAVQAELYERLVPVTVGEETDALIREYYESRGEEVPPEYRGLGKKDNAVRDEFVKKYEDAGGQPWQEGNAEPKPKAKAATQKARSTDIRFGEDIDNQYKMFSNFAPTPVTMTTAGETVTFPTVEHYYQSMKFRTSDPDWARRIREAPTPQKAREMGHSKEHKKEPTFEKHSTSFYMKRAVEEKFSKEDLRQLLISTVNSRLIQSDADRDVDKKGDNYLGKLLMEIRKSFMEQDEMPKLDGGGKTMAELRAEKAARTRKNNAGAGTEEALASQKKPETGKTTAALGPSDCKGGRRPGEKYRDACVRARECLKTLAKAKMTIGQADGLANYSAKYSAMLEKIAAAPGSSLVYSQFLDMEGIGIFRVAMDVNGYAPIEITLVGNTVAFTAATEKSLRLGPGKQPRYLTFSGGEKQEVRRAALDLFNAKFAALPESMNKILTEAGYTDNKAGELCRVFCITSAGAEGLSLRNVRAVHIMEPYWNEVRLRQVKGRAIRIGSHLDLAEDQRDVAIYTYISCFSEAAQKDRTGVNKIDETLLLHDSVDMKRATELGLPIKPGMTTYVLTTDEMIYTISERKRKIIEALECILKTAAVDCELNFKQNKDKTFKCLPLKGKVGDFIYNPVLEEDVREGSKFEGSENICTGTIKAQEMFQKISKVPYFLREVLNEAGDVTGYDVFAANEVDEKGKKVIKKVMPEKKMGTVGVRKVEGVDKPGPPIKIQQS